MITTKKTVGYAVLTIVVIVFSSNFPSIECSSASEESEVDAETVNIPFEIDPMCDCNDPDALYNKIVRQVINAKGKDGLERFLQEFRPKRVCGSDGNRYGNGCELQCAISKDSDLHQVRGCRKRFNRHGPKNVKKRTMKIQSERKSAALKMKSDESESAPETQSLEHPRVCICPRHYFPVCASNGITYGNMCAFRCAKENIIPDLTVARHGRCKEEDETIL